MSIPVPPATLNRVPQIQAANRALVQAFEAHPAFQSQQSQRQGNIYFMWDFANRTNSMFESASQGQGGQQTQVKKDAIGRCMMLNMMITDTTGMTAMMFGQAPGGGEDVGDSVRRASSNVDKALEGKEQDAPQAAAS